MTRPRDIQLVIFDLGRVLVRICDDWHHACQCAGIKLSAAPIDVGRMDRLRELALQQEIGAIGSEAFFGGAATLMGLSAAQVRAASEAYIRGAYPGVVALVDELIAAGVATACLSNTNEHHWQIVSNRDHPGYFPLERMSHRFASHLVKARKPEDAIYAHVERSTGIAPSALLFFDDVPENVEAARRRGWKACRIDPALDDPIPQIRAALREHRVLP